VPVEFPVLLRSFPHDFPFPSWHKPVAARMIATREFTFLHQTTEFAGAIPWNGPGVRRLWLHHLNYFDYLNVEFGPGEEEFLLRRALDLAVDWCDSNRRGTEAGWEPYPLSLRIVNWLKFLARNEAAIEQIGEQEKKRRIVATLGVQVAALAGRLETDILANHLIKNLKALLFAGAWLESAHSNRWWTDAAGLLAEQLEEQILPDGGHFERSPMYHSQVLADLVEIELLCAATEQRLPCSELLSAKIAAMSRFLTGIAHPDGEIPLFNDSALGEVSPPIPRSESRRSAESEKEPPSGVFPDSGYAVVRNPACGSALIFDCGPLGPSYQPGHGHCDLLSYELSLQGQRVVVDTGVSTYEPGGERLFERSTAAHNTLRVDGEEQAEIWGSFRVGRRPEVGHIRSGRTGNWQFVSGHHSAYQRQGVEHARHVFWQSPDTWVIADLLSGVGTHRFEFYLHFHPRIHLEPDSQPVGVDARLPQRWMVSWGSHAYRLLVLGGGAAELRESRYSERFGQAVPALMLYSAWERIVPTGMLHVFAPASTPLPRINVSWTGEWIEVGGERLPLSRPTGTFKI
jgi:uncharacterized heparinase superfamily protein